MYIVSCMTISMCPWFPPLQCSLKGGFITVEEGTRVVDALAVRVYLDDQEDLVWKRCGDLVYGECYLVYVKDIDFEDS